MGKCGQRGAHLSARQAQFPAAAGARRRALITRTSVAHARNFPLELLGPFNPNVHLAPDPSPGPRARPPAIPILGYYLSTAAVLTLIALWPGRETRDVIG